MANYPNLPILRSGSNPQRSDGRDESLAVGGAKYVRSFYDTDRIDFQFEHRALTAAQWASLLSHYNANRTTTFSFFWPQDGATYTGMRYGKDGLREKVSEVPFCWDVTVRLISA
jgi:hypothetical protein